jgi:hypothetical protein
MGAVEDQRPARGQHPRGFRQHGFEVVDIGRNPQCRDGRERTAGEREGGRVRLDDPAAPALGDAQLVGRAVEADHGPPGGGESIEVVSAGLNQAGGNALARADRFFPAGFTRRVVKKRFRAPSLSRTEFSPFRLLSPMTPWTDTGFWMMQIRS